MALLRLPGGGEVASGGAMSLGRTATFLDIYIERDLRAGLLNEEQAQELIDHFIMKIRMVRFLRTPEFDSLFSGDPIWATEVLGGMGLDGRTLVSKTTFRYLHTLHTMGPAPEPNLTVLWSQALPAAFKKYAARVSIATSSLQYRERRSDAQRFSQRRLRHRLLRPARW